MLSILLRDPVLLRSRAEDTTAHQYEVKAALPAKLTPLYLNDRVELYTHRGREGENLRDLVQCCCLAGATMEAQRGCLTCSRKHCVRTEGLGSKLGFLALTRCFLR